MIIQLANGTLLSSGSNSHGQLGHGDNKNIHKFEEIKCLPINIVDVACGRHHTIIRLIDSTLMSCGSNIHGQLGNYGGVFRDIFRKIKNIPKNVSSISCGDYYTVIKIINIRTGATKFMSCGQNTYGQLGLGDQIDTFHFEKIKLPRG